jgi:hypothetical protein
MQSSKLAMDYIDCLRSSAIKHKRKKTLLLELQLNDYDVFIP